MTREGAPSLWLLLMIGALAGVLSGAFGVGGGVLIVPALVLLAGMAQKRASGTSLAAVVPISIVGAIGYLASGHVDLVVAGLLMAGTVVGAVVGARLLARIPETPLRWLFIAFLALVAIRMLFVVPERGGDFAVTPAIAAILVGVGLVTGVLSGLLGVGGGVFMVPVLVLFLGMGDIVSKGVSLVVVIPTGIISTVVSLRRGNVDLRAAAAVGIPGALTSLAGVALALWLPARPAAILFAVLLLLVAARMAYQAIRRRRPVASPPVPAEPSR